MKRNLLIVAALLLNSFISNAQSWIVQNTMFPNQFTGVNDISVPAPGIVWITGYDGSGSNNNYIDFSRTFDGGVSWAGGTVGTDTNYQFSNLHAINVDTAWVCMFNQIAGANGGVWKTTDGGANWAQQDPTMFQGAASFADFVHFWDGDTGVTVGDPDGGYFEIYNTNDGGATWTRTPQGNIPANLSGEFAIVDYYDWYENTIWFATNKGRVYKSIDRGLNWTVATVLSLPSTQSMKVKFLDSNNGLASVTITATGALVSLRRTTDGGTTWTTQTVTGKFFTAEFGRIPGSGTYMSTGVVFSTPGEKGTSYSIDGGASWTIIDTLQHTAFASYDYDNTWSGSFNFFDVSFVNVDGIFKLDTTGISVVAVNDQHNVKANINAYPNPGSGIVTMNFKIGRNVDVRVSVVNMIGEQVYSSKFINVSMFTHTFDFSYLPKGVYMLNLEYGSERSTQRLVIQ